MNAEPAPRAGVSALTLRLLRAALLALALALSALALVTFAGIERHLPLLGHLPETRLALALGLSIGPFGRGVLYATLASACVALYAGLSRR